MQMELGFRQGNDKVAGAFCASQVSFTGAGFHYFFGDACSAVLGLNSLRWRL